MSFVDLPRRSYIDATLAVYELGRWELLRDVFAWAYMRSCEQFTVIRDAIPQPDVIRLRYRVQLADFVRDTIRADLPPRQEHVRAWATRHAIPADDVDLFVERAFERVLSVNEATAARAGLRLSEFVAWRRQFSNRTP